MHRIQRKREFHFLLNQSFNNTPGSVNHLQMILEKISKPRLSSPFINVFLPVFFTKLALGSFKAFSPRIFILNYFIEISARETRPSFAPTIRAHDCNTGLLSSPVLSAFLSPLHNLLRYLIGYEQHIENLSYQVTRQ